MARATARVAFTSGRERAPASQAASGGDASADALQPRHSARYRRRAAGSPPSSSCRCTRARRAGRLRRRRSEPPASACVSCRRAQAPVQAHAGRSAAQEEPGHALRQGRGVELGQQPAPAVAEELQTLHAKRDAHRLQIAQIIVDLEPLVEAEGLPGTARIQQQRPALRRQQPAPPAPGSPLRRPGRAAAAPPVRRVRRRGARPAAPARVCTVTGRPPSSCHAGPRSRGSQARMPARSLVVAMPPLPSV